MIDNRTMQRYNKIALQNIESAKFISTIRCSFGKWTFLEPNQTANLIGFFYAQNITQLINLKFNANN